MKIRQRLSLGFAAILVLIAVMVVIAVSLLGRIGDDASDAFHHGLAKERLINRWQTNIGIAVKRTTVIARAGDPALAAAFADDARAITESTAEVMRQIEALIADADEREAFAKVGEQRKRYLAARDAVMASVGTGKVDDARRGFERDYLPVSRAYLDAVETFAQRQRGLIDARATSIDDARASAVNMLLGSGFVAIALGLAVSWWLARSIVMPLQRAEAEADAIAGGDLTHSIDGAGGDEAAALLRSLARMQAQLRTLVTDVRDGAHEMTSASQEIVQGGADLSTRTEEQALNLQMTASAMEQFAQMVDQNAESARHASGLVTSATDDARRGGEVVGDMIRTMNDISSSSSRIGDIIGVIDGIAFQTNILALNAAVEAARAGEQGRGFAVVASEVRALAQRSAGAAREIKDLIEASGGRVGQGVDLAARVGKTMEEVVTSVTTATDLMMHIANAMIEQASGLREVKGAILDIDSTTQRNAALAEESAAAAGGLTDQAHKLNAAIGAFRL